MLTEYGRYLQTELIPLVEKLDRLPEVLQTMARLHGETIHLNVLAASSLVTDAIIEYKANHRALNFQLLQNAQEDIFDIELTTKMFYQSNARRGKNEFVCEEKIYLAVPNNEKYRSRTSITLAEVEQEGFISLMGSRQFRYICDKFCHHARIQPHIIFESDSPAAVKNMIAANLGVGFWPEFTWGEVANEKVRLLEISDPICSRDIVITCNHNKTDHSNVDDFFEFIKAFCIKQKYSMRRPV